MQEARELSPAELFAKVLRRDRAPWPNGVPRVTQNELVTAVKYQTSAFGSTYRDMTFVCVKCGLAQSPRLFEAITPLKKAEIEKQIAFSCVGRSLHEDDVLRDSPVFVKLGNGIDRRTKDESLRLIGCDWSVGGLFGNLGFGIEVELPSGEVSPGFPIAPIEAAFGLREFLIKEGFV